MIRIVVANQRGGSAKSTTTATLARCFADRGKRVLVIDADPQGSLAVILGLDPPAFLNDLLIEKLAFRECIVTARPGLDIICGNRFTTDAETKTMGLPGSEFLFQHVLSEYQTQLRCGADRCRAFHQPLPDLRHGLHAERTRAGRYGHPERAGRNFHDPRLRNAESDA